MTGCYRLDCKFWNVHNLDAAGCNMVIPLESDLIRMGHLADVRAPTEI